MLISPVSLAPVYNSMVLNQAEVLEEDDFGILIHDAYGHTLMFWHEDFKTNKKWLKKHLKNHPDCLVLTMQTGLGSYLKRYLPLENKKTCRQFVLTGQFEDVFDHIKEMRIYIKKDGGWYSPLFSRTIKPRPAEVSDISWIHQNYNLVSEEETKRAIEANRLFVFANKEGQTIGFAGEHAEGSMGFLTVLPEFRNQKYGLMMEAWLIEFEKKRNLVPYCHVFEDNIASLELQRELDLYECVSEIEWMWQI